MAKVKDLKQHTKNPRKITDKKLEALGKSLLKFGDLSGIVKNIRSGMIISGNQRSKALPPECTIKIEKKYDKPNKFGTVAEGYIELDGEHFKYREVDFDEKTEMEALLSANKSGGSWDHDILRVNFSDFPDMELDLTGFDVQELRMMDIKVPDLQAISQIVGISDDSDDEEYLSENKGLDERFDKERLPDMINRGPTPKDEPAPVKDIDPYEAVNEKTEIDKPIIIIIHCNSEDHKKEVKEKIRDIVESSNAKFF